MNNVQTFHWYLVALTETCQTDAGDVCAHVVIVLRYDHNKTETSSSARLTTTNNSKQETVEQNLAYTSNHEVIQSIFHRTTCNYKFHCISG